MLRIRSLGRTAEEQRRQALRRNWAGKAGSLRSPAPLLARSLSATHLPDPRPALPFSRSPFAPGSPSRPPQRALKDAPAGGLRPPGPPCPMGLSPGPATAPCMAPPTTCRCPRPRAARTARSMAARCYPARSGRRFRGHCACGVTPEMGPGRKWGCAAPMGSAGGSAADGAQKVRPEGTERRADSVQGTAPLHSNVQGRLSGLYRAQRLQYRTQRHSRQSRWSSLVRNKGRAGFVSNIDCVAQLCKRENPDVTVQREVLGHSCLLTVC